ncbi:Ribosomal protein S12 methylthiotransferase RimO [Pseudomonas syringae pv. maculicola]|uniref:Ribosomal protein S12 methylthiotransferase RimO n=1 Tax=Pseudomonas syringae pv. maculicola TaxID=59511 RepID=A0A3M2TUX1_PSEYM|nr:Ribosomal protein S12 methylthiotransferase RimO [Pseudomonas syringae pv. maculicola]
MFIGLEDGSTVQPGDKIMCRVTDADEYDLWAEML